MRTPTAPPRSPNLLTRGYLLALGLIAVLSVATHLTSRRVVLTHQDSAALVNVAGRQRMLSQRISHFCLRLATSQSEAGRAEARASLAAAIDLFARSHEALIKGDPEQGLADARNESVQSLYFGQLGVDARARQFLLHARAVASAPDSSLSLTNPDLVYVTEEGPTTVLDGLERVVVATEQAGRDEIDALGQVLQLGLASTLLALLVSALFIFRPMVRRISVETSKLAASEQKLGSILETVGEAILLLDENGNILSGNPEAQTVWGHALTELHGSNIGRLLSDRDRSTFRPGDPALLGRRLELEGQKLDGTLFPLEIRITSARSGEQPLLTAAVRDITDRKLMERMKSEFVSTVSHELRTPVTAIRGALGLLEGGAAGEVPEAARELVRVALRNCERLARLLNDILDQEKIEAGKMEFRLEEVELSALVTQAVADIRGYGEEFAVHFKLTAEQPGLWVRADPHRLTQVLTNLLGNAAKFSPRGGSVEVSLARAPGVARVMVTDHGPGIPHEFRHRLFQRFAQLDASNARQKGGTGLGLSISKSIIDVLGGRIGFDSSTQGTTFFVELPQIQVATPVAALPCQA